MSTKRTRAPGHSWELNASVLRRGMMARVERNTEFHAQLAFSAIPVLIDHHMAKCDAIFTSAGRPLEPHQRSEFRSLLSRALEQAFGLSSHAKIVVQFNSDPPPRVSMSYQIGIQTKAIADVYTAWLGVPDQPYFGKHPDAKVMSVAAEIPRGRRALDIGAGTGRNALPLAKSGLAVDAIEMTPGFVELMRAAAEAEKLPLTVLEGDAFDPALKLPAAGYGLIVASEVVSSHARDLGDLHAFFDLASAKLEQGGLLVFNVFIPRAGYALDLLAKQLAPSFLTAVFTEADLREALEQFPLTLVSNESCAEYEREHLPPEAWPPTPWFEPWANGNNLFDIPTQPPIELRWLVVRRA